MPAGWSVEGSKIGNPGDVKVARVSESGSLDVGRSPGGLGSGSELLSAQGALIVTVRVGGLAPLGGGVLHVRGGASGLQVWGAGQGP